VRLRCRDDDFVVEEETSLTVARAGPYGLYRLKKRGLTTPEAVKRVSLSAHVDSGRIRFCGLKDRHAVTEQHVTIFGESVPALHGEGFELKPLGRTQRAASSTEILGNSFRINVRDLSEAEARSAADRAERYARTGIPNYFDDQRFGSARSTGEFPAEALCRGDAERALWLLLAAWSREDSSEVKKNRRLVSEHWRNWPVLKSKLGKSSERAIVTYLCDHPDDFTGAFDRLSESLCGIILAAFQSLLWNEVLSSLVRSRCTSHWTYHGRYDDTAFFDPEPDVVRPVEKLVVPMPHRSTKSGDADVTAALGEALTRHGLTPASFRLRGLKKTYFWRGERGAVARVTGFSRPETAVDELDRKRHALKLRFTLPSGAYATMFIKACLGPTQSQPNRHAPAKIDGPDGGLEEPPDVE
jgi:tRNA pseudouridine13 synthase